MRAKAVTADEQYRLIMECRVSGMTDYQWCVEHDIKPGTLIETARVNGLDAMKYIRYILSDMPGSTFLQNPEYLDDYLPWDPTVQELC